MNVNMMRFGRSRFVVLLAMVGAVSGLAQSARMQIGWPTPNHAYAEGKPLEAFIQPTVSEVVESGVFGCVRTSGRQFHEALDLLPVGRDDRGEPTDEVYSILDGVVRHINAVAGNSSYGRYVVVEHVNVSPTVYTLYAHLAAIDDGISQGARVQLGQVLGIMGRSAGGYSIPKERAHLHFEIGLRLTDDFQRWYTWKRFGSKNDQGLWNGMNLVGIDPLAFYEAFREKKVDTFSEYFRGLDMAVKIRVATTKTPDFTRRYPDLVVGAVPEDEVAGWQVSFDRFGVPFAWTPLRDDDVKGFLRDEVRIVDTNRELTDACKCKDLIKGRGSRPEPDVDLQRLLQQLFEIKR
jgi:murein DD-endopeptidase MepM/ murein hydrolase activator NlpD